MTTDLFQWTAEAVDRLKRLADGTRSASEIASEMKITRSAVIGKINRLQKSGEPRLKLLPGTGSRGRVGPKKAKPRGKVQTVRRLVPVRSKPKPPTFLKAPLVADLIAQAPVVDEGVAPAPMPFGEAVDRKRCLFFAGHPYAAASPDMMVCGATRLTDSRILPPYCRKHLALQYEKRRAA